MQEKSLTTSILQDSLHILRPFAISAASPNDWILELHSSDKTFIGQVFLALGLPLLPILSEAHLKLESGIEFYLHVST